jgi:hypothetical protein
LRGTCRSSAAAANIVGRLTGIKEAHLAARAVALTCAIAVGLSMPGFAQQADDAHAGDSRFMNGADIAMVRFEFDNDSPFGSDDAFTAGWSLQLHSGLTEEWDGPFGSLLAKTNLFGDDDEGGRIVRRSFGLTQLMSSPNDLEIEELQPDEPPYAGVLGIHGSWSAYDNRRLTALQLYVGCMGPCSGAEHVQKFVHNDLGLGEDPQGWDNQLDTEWLGNVNFAWKWKVFAPAEDRYQPGRWANDFAVGGQLGAGNAATYADAQLEYRLGLGLPMGFTHIPDQAPRGVILDPLYVPASERAQPKRAWRGYLSAVLRGIAMDEVIVIDGGRTTNGLHHPGAEDNDTISEALVGLHVGRLGYTFHFTYSRVLTGEEGIHSDSAWLNFSFERRF